MIFVAGSILNPRSDALRAAADLLRVMSAKDLSPIPKCSRPAATSTKGIGDAAHAGCPP